MKFRLIRGKHLVNGVRVVVGAVVDLTENQARNWKDKFEPVVEAAQVALHEAVDETRTAVAEFEAEWLDK